MTRAGFDIRPIAAGELEAFLDVLGTAYGLTVDQDYFDAWRPAFDYRRSLALFLDGRLTGTATGARVDVTVPGPRVIDAVCTGNLTVAADAPSPGLAREIFRRQCERERRDGTPLLVFSVTSAMRALHPRIGSAPATARRALTLTPLHGTGTPTAGVALRNVSPLDPEPEILRRRIARHQVGMIIREPELMAAVQRLRERAAPSTVSMLEDADGRAVASAVWRATDGIVAVEDILAETDADYAALVVELFAHGPVRLDYWRADDPLRRLLSEHASFVRGELHAAVWIRLLDICAALETRRYAGSERIVLDVEDSFLPGTGGTFLLEGSPDGAHCRRVDSPWDVQLGVGALAALYLGGISPATLLADGRAVPLDDDAACRFRALFETDYTPWSGFER